MFNALSLSGNGFLSSEIFVILSVLYLNGGATLH